MEIWCDTDGRAAHVRIATGVVTDRTTLDGMTIGLTHEGTAVGIMFERRVTDETMEQAIARFPELAELRDLDSWRIAPQRYP